ncbi:hypothetical protein HMPREF1431_01258 [Helicobacter pylori GAMchJs106B]|nr:hypothetical protein HMPREF1431_01258 [Helicobacter pylori GAMchJs106B]
MFKGIFKNNERACVKQPNILLKKRSSWVRGFSWGYRGELFQNTPIPL